MLEFYDFVYMGIFVLVILVLKEIIEYVFITRRRNNVTQFNNKRDIIENFYENGETCRDDTININSVEEIQGTPNCNKVSFTYCNENWPKLATILKLSLDEINKLKFLIKCISIKDTDNKIKTNAVGDDYNYIAGGNNQSIFLDANLYLGKKSGNEFKCSKDNIRDLFTSIVNTKEIRGWKYSDTDLLSSIETASNLRGTDTNYEYNSVPGSGDDYGVSIISNKLNLKSAVEVYGGLEVSGKIDSYLNVQNNKDSLICDLGIPSLRVWPKKKDEGVAFEINKNTLDTITGTAVRSSQQDSCYR